MKELIRDKNKKDEVLKKFIERFVKPDYVYDDKSSIYNFMWNNYKLKPKGYPTEKLFDNNIPVSGKVYFYDEFEKKLSITDFNDIQQMVNDAEPWMEIDAQIFNDNLDWNIGITHKGVTFVTGLDIKLEECDKKII